MTSPGTNAIPTHAELIRGLQLATDSQTATWRAIAIAQALADQRAKYEALADELGSIEAEDIHDEGENGWVSGMSTAAERIRKVSG